MSTPAGFTSIKVGSGHSQGGSDYSGGQEVIGIYTGTFTTSAMTVNPYASATSTFAIGSTLTPGDFLAVMPVSTNSAAFTYSAFVSAAGVASLTGFNSNATAATQGAVAFRWLGVKVVP